MAQSGWRKAINWDIDRNSQNTKLLPVTYAWTCPSWPTLYTVPDPPHYSSNVAVHSVKIMFTYIFMANDFCCCVFVPPQSALHATYRLNLGHNRWY